MLRRPHLRSGLERWACFGKMKTRFWECRLCIPNQVRHPLFARMFIQDRLFIASSVSRASSSPTTTPSGIPAADPSSPTCGLADILSQFQNLEVARLGSACGYWSGWIERQQSIDGNVDASSSGDIGARKPRVVAQRDQLEKPIKGTTTTDEKGKGKESTAVPALGCGLGDWEIGLEGEGCEGWDWAGVAGIWR